MALVETTVSGGARGHYGSRMTALILLLVALREGSGTIIVWRQRLLLAATNYLLSSTEQQCSPLQRLPPSGLHHTWTLNEHSRLLTKITKKRNNVEQAKKCVSTFSLALFLLLGWTFNIVNCVAYQG